MLPLLSIIVPTKNRHVLIRQLIESIDGTVPKNIEYIIYDNSTASLVVSITQYEQIRYFHDPLNMSVGANFSKALTKARGWFVAYMGDDDEANHQELVVTLSKPGIVNYDTIVSPVYDLLFHGGSSTRWTGVFHKKTKLKINFAGRSILLVIYLLSRWTHKFTYFWLFSPDLWAVPRGYFGIFRRELLNSKNAREIYLSPDAYLIGRLSHARSTLYTSRQLFTPGTSAASTSNLSNSREHIGAISQQIHFDKADIERLPRDIPDSFLPEVIWAASYLSAIMKGRITQLHLSIIEQFVRLKYGINIRERVGKKKDLSHTVVSICGLILGSLCFMANRVMVAALIVARYKFSSSRKCDVD